MRRGALWLLRPDALPEIIFACAFAAAVAMSKIPLVTPDSGGYVSAGQVLVGGASPGQPSPAWGSVSFVGDSFRAWPAALFYWLAPGGATTWVIIQAILVVAATILLARSLAFLIPARGRWVMRSAVYLLALTPSALSYALVIGAEPVAYVLSMATISACLGLVRHRTVWTSRTLLLAALGIWALSTMTLIARPSVLPAFIVVTLVVGAAAGQKVMPGRLWAWCVGLAGAVLLVGISVTYSSTIQSKQSLAWANGNVVSTHERAHRAFYAVDAGTNPTYASFVRRNLPADTPRCLREYPAAPLDWGQQADWGRRECGPAGLAWIQDNYFSMLAHVYLSEPRTAIRYFLDSGQTGTNVQAQAAEVLSPSSPEIEQAIGADEDPARYNVPLLLLIASMIASAVLVVRSFLGEPWRPTTGRARALTLAALTLSVWASFYLSFFDHPAAANRKSWPFLLIGVAMTITLLATAARRTSDAREKRP